MLSCSYLFNIDFKPKVNFNGPTKDKDDETASEDLDVSNIAFFIDNEKTNDSPFKLMGLEARVGINFAIGN